MALIFQYGSNMSVERLNHADRLAGDARVRGIARTVESFHLDFTVWSHGNGCAAADMVPDDAGRSLYGVLYEIPDDRLQRSTMLENRRTTMDDIENEGVNYLRHIVQLHLPDGTGVSATTYLVKQRRGGLRTELPYVRHMLDGLRQHRMPPEYLRYVHGRILRNNPSLRAALDAARESWADG